MAPPSLSRRELFVASGALVALAACGDDGEGTGGSGTTAGDDRAYELIAGFPRDQPYVVPDVPQRLPFLIAVAQDAPLDDIEGPVPFEVRDPEGGVVAETDVEPHAEGLPRAYLPLEVTLPAAGIYTARATYRGQSLESALMVSPAADVTMVQTGATVPTVTTPTTAKPAGVSPICTREPACPFHDHDLAAVAGNGRPTVLLIGTPLYCQTAICGPVLELMIEDLASRDDLDVIHAEVYANPEQVDSILDADTAPVVDAFGLPFEPILYGLDGTGKVVRRLDLIWDRAELDDLVDALTS